METTVIAKINEIDVLVKNGNNRLVPIRPICEILKIDYKSQYTKLQEDEELSLLVRLSTTVAADGKVREMVCLPIEYVFGWLFTINPKNVKEEARPAVKKYRMECYKALYEYFAEPHLFLEHKQERIKEKMKVYEESISSYKNAKKTMNMAKTDLDEAMKYSIEDWRMGKRQLEMDFTEQE